MNGKLLKKMRKDWKWPRQRFNNKHSTKYYREQNVMGYKSFYAIDSFSWYLWLLCLLRFGKSSGRVMIPIEIELGNARLPARAKRIHIKSNILIQQQHSTLNSIKTITYPVQRIKSTSLCVFFMAWTADTTRSQGESQW